MSEIIFIVSKQQNQGAPYGAFKYSLDDAFARAGEDGLWMTPQRAREIIESLTKAVEIAEGPDPFAAVT